MYRGNVATFMHDTSKSCFFAENCEFPTVYNLGVLLLYQKADTIESRNFCQRQDRLINIIFS